MQFTIENDQLRVTVDSLGCEVVSVEGKKDGCEYLWTGDPQFWSGHAPTMFPICGRLNEGKYFYDGKEYEMNLGKGDTLFIYTEKNRVHHCREDTVFHYDENHRYR